MTTETSLDPAILDGINTFLSRMVHPVEDLHSGLLTEPERFYGSDGAYADDVVDLMREVRMTSAEAGFYGLFAPLAWGGHGLPKTAYFTVWEHLYAKEGPGRLLPYEVIAHWTKGPSFLLDHLSEAVKKEVAPRIVSGESTTCFAMSEPDAGSDAWSMTTRAVKDGEDWLLTGTKQWISGASFAEYAFVFAVTDEAQRSHRRGGVTCFIVPTSAKGFTVDSTIKMFGSIGGKEAIVSLNSVRVPNDNIVGQLDAGFDLALAGVSLGRIYNAARSVGLARWALNQAVQYAGVRETFGSPIIEHQAISMMLADSATEVYAARAMSMDCAERIDSGRRADAEVAMAKVFATEMCFRVYDRCMQVHGAMGFTNELKLYDGWHQSRLIRVADGSAEVLRRNIARHLARGRIDFDV